MFIYHPITCKNNLNNHLMYILTLRCKILLMYSPHPFSSNGICVSTFIFGCLPVPQSFNARPNISHLKYAFFLTRGCPSFACRNFCFPAQQMVIHTPIARGRSLIESIDTDRTNVRRLYP